MDGVVVRFGMGGGEGEMAMYAITVLRQGKRESGERSRFSSRK